MNAPDPLGSAVDVDHDVDDDDDDDVEHVWESREVRWSALAGLLLIVGALSTVEEASRPWATVTSVVEEMICTA